MPDYHNVCDKPTGPIVRKAGVHVGRRPSLNLIEGANVTITATEDTANDEIDVTIAATGGGAGTSDHDQLTNVSADDHHPQLHAAAHATGQGDALTPAAIGAAASGHNHDGSYAGAGHTHTLVDGDIPASIARDSEVTSAIAAHEGGANPHPTYLTQAEGDAAYAATGHSHGGGGGVTGGAIRKTGNQTMTATAQTAITDLSFAVDASSTYYFQVTVIVTTSSGTSPTTAYGVTGPASPTAVAITREQDTSTSVEASSVITSFTTFAAGAQVANTKAVLSGVVQTGAASGTVQITAARGGTTPSMVVAAGSGGFWLKLA